MRQGPSPLVGYNTNVRHKGKLYHIQTEDSGVNHPHVITHLFADGGRIIASRKTGYAEHLGARDLQGIVKKLMQDQHKSMFIELRDCVYDEDGAAEQNGAQTTADHPAAKPHKPAEPAAATSRSSTAADRPPSKPMDIDALERAAEARMAESPVARSRNEPRRGVGRYQQTLPAQPKHLSRPPPAASIFGGEVLRGKSLDEVILSYLSDDIGESER